MTGLIEGFFFFGGGGGLKPRDFFEFCLEALGIFFSFVGKP